MILRSRIQIWFSLSSIVAIVVLTLTSTLTMASRTLAFSSSNTRILWGRAGTRSVGGALRNPSKVRAWAREPTLPNSCAQRQHMNNGFWRRIATANPLYNLKATLCNDEDPMGTEEPRIQPGLTVREALDESIQRLETKNVTEPDYSALYLMAASLQLPWERGIRDLQTGFGGNDNILSAILTDEQANDLEGMLRQREEHEPIQYILGKWDFLDYTIEIRKPILCPRPETEELVMKIVEETTESPVHILDVGCGTGVIGISLAELLPDATVEAIDIETVAVETSMENAQRVLKDQTGGIDTYPDCYKATLVSAGDYRTDHPFDIVVSNPPYIPRGDMEGLTDDVTGFESDRALCGGNDGLDVIRTIIQKLPQWCNSEAVCWMEVDPTHPKMIEELLLSDDELSSGGRVRFESSHKDMFGKDRFVKLRVVKY